MQLQFENVTKFHRVFGAQICEITAHCESWLKRDREYNGIEALLVSRVSPEDRPSDRHWDFGFCKPHGKQYLRIILSFRTSWQFIDNVCNIYTYSAY